jgi:outer membrane receptor protein involved in Fe transport
MAYDLALPNGNWELYLSMSNLFDQEPPLAPTAGGGVFGTAQSPPDFDPIGRRYAIGVRWSY